MNNPTLKVFPLICISLMFTLVSCASLNRGQVRNSWQGSSSPIKKALINLSESNEKFSVAPIVNKITLLDRGLASRKEVKEWEEATRNHTIAEMEQSLLSLNIPNLQVVDRNTIETVLSQLKFNMAISNDERIELGKQMGATHLIITDITRGSDHTWSGEKVFKDTYSKRLIEIQSGEVLGSQSSTISLR